MLPSPHTTRAFDDGAALASDLAVTVADHLATAISTRGIATIALSGGRTPAAFLAALFKQELEWARVQLTLVDDRCVPHASERSNVRLLEAARNDTPAAAATLIALTDADTGAPCADTELPETLDVLILGMGTDGHTASLFPAGDRLSDALAPGAPRLLAMTAPGAPEPRVTFSLPAILAARTILLHTEGAAKHDTLRTALSAGPVEDMPIRAILRQVERPVTLFTQPAPGSPA